VRKISTVTKKGQVTIPRIIREKLQINCGDKVEFTFNKQGQVVLQPVKINLNNLYGILKNEKLDLDIDEQRKNARDWIASQKGRG
jgi:AbrB family looped-hinge helix DNA binding protein